MPTVAQARTRRAETTAELAVKIIARREAQKVFDDKSQRLVLRKMWFSLYDPLTNLHDPNVFRQMGWKGICLPISQIALRDVEFQIPQIRLDLDESKDQNEAVQGQGGQAGEFGPGMGAEDVPRDGYRRSNSATIAGVKIGIRCYMKQLDQVMNSAKRYDNSILHYSIVHVRDENQLTTQSWKPKAEQVLPIRPWGYDSSLDLSEETKAGNVKYRTLYRGSVSLHPTHESCVQKNVDRYVHFKKPLKYKYSKLEVSQAGIVTEKADDSGQWPTKGALYFVLRSNIPESLPEEMILVSAFSKTYYRDT